MNSNQTKQSLSMTNDSIAVKRGCGGSAVWLRPEYVVDVCVLRTKSCVSCCFEGGEGRVSYK